MSVFAKLLILLLVFNGLDLWYSHQAFLQGAVEGNPLLSHIFELYGITGIAVVKGFFLIALITLYVVSSIIKLYIKILLFFVACVYTVLTAYHVGWFSMPVLFGT